MLSFWLPVCVDDIVITRHGSPMPTFERHVVERERKRIFPFAFTTQGTRQDNKPSERDPLFFSSPHSLFGEAKRPANDTHNSVEKVSSRFSNWLNKKGHNEK
jgi:hypothetical protein